MAEAKQTGGFRLSGWKITGYAGIAGTMPTPIPFLSGGLATQTLTLEHETTKKTATYGLKGIQGSFGADLEKKFAFLKYLKGRGISVGPSAMPTEGTKIFVTPWVDEPVEPNAFDGFCAVVGASFAVGLGFSPSYIVFSSWPWCIGPTGIVATALLKGGGAFMGSGFSPPTASLDAFHAMVTLKS